MSQFQASVSVIEKAEVTCRDASFLKSGRCKANVQKIAVKPYCHLLLPFNCHLIIANLPNITIQNQLVTIALSRNQIYFMHSPFKLLSDLLLHPQNPTCQKVSCKNMVGFIKSTISLDHLKLLRSFFAAISVQKNTFIHVYKWTLGQYVCEHYFIKISDLLSKILSIIHRMVFI